MFKKIYKVLLLLSIIIVGLSLGLTWILNPPWNAGFAVLAGGAMSLIASLLLQSFASAEQSQMIKALTLEAEGVSELPDAFRRIKWFAWATKRANPNDPEGNKVTQWFVSRLTKVGGSGPRFLTYTLDVPNLVNDNVTYNCTFVGLNSCVIATISRENEPASAVIFSCDVPDAGVFFGTGCLTDWCADRDLTLGIVGTGDMPEIPNLQPNIFAAFDHWYKKFDWIVEDAQKLIRPVVKQA